jgi:hypothetical protein
MDTAASTLATVIAASIAAVASVTTLILNAILTTTREKRKALWEKELERFFGLEERAGQLAEDLFSYRCRSEDEKKEFYANARHLRDMVGRFLRYQDVAKALRQFNHSANWYFAQDMKHDSRKEFEEARKDLEESHQDLLRACDRALGRPK